MLIRCEMSQRELTRDDLHSLYAKRVCVDLAYTVDHMPGSIEGLEPEGHRHHWTSSIVDLLIYGLITY